MELVLIIVIVLVLVLVLVIVIVIVIYLFSSSDEPDCRLATAPAVNSYLDSTAGTVAHGGSGWQGRKLSS